MCEYTVVHSNDTFVAKNASQPFAHPSSQWHVSGLQSPAFLQLPLHASLQFLPNVPSGQAVIYDEIKQEAFMCYCFYSYKFIAAIY